MRFAEKGDYARIKDEREKKKDFRPALGALCIIISDMAMVSVKLSAKLLFVKYP